MLQIQEQQDALDDCDHAVQLIEALLAKTCPQNMSDASLHGESESVESVGADAESAASIKDPADMDRALLQRRLSSVQACSSQAAATMQALEASLHDRRATLHALQVRSCICCNMCCERSA